jgi:hypothetical protein
MPNKNSANVTLSVVAMALFFSAAGSGRDDGLMSNTADVKHGHT